MQCCSMCEDGLETEADEGQSSITAEFKVYLNPFKYRSYGAVAQSARTRESEHVCTQQLCPLSQPWHLAPAQTPPAAASGGGSTTGLSSSQSPNDLHYLILKLQAHLSKLRDMLARLKVKTHILLNHRECVLNMFYSFEYNKFMS